MSTALDVAGLGPLWALVPARRFSHAKTRLRGCLDPSARATLARRMLEHVLEVIGTLSGLGGIAVLTDGEDVANVAADFGATVLFQRVDDHGWQAAGGTLRSAATGLTVGRGLRPATTGLAEDAPIVLPAAGAVAGPGPEHAAARLPADGALGRIIDDGLEQLRGLGAVSGLVVMADLPWLRAEEACALVGRLRTSDLVIAPDERGEGTNALGIARIDGFSTHFGHADSFARHVMAAEQSRQKYEIYRSAGLELDVDTAAQLARLELEIETGPQLARLADDAEAGLAWNQRSNRKRGSWVSAS